MTATAPWLKVERKQKKKGAGIYWWCKKKTLRKVDMLGKIQSAP